MTPFGFKFLFLLKKANKSLYFLIFLSSCINKWILYSFFAFTNLSTISGVNLVLFLINIIQSISPGFSFAVTKLPSNINCFMFVLKGMINFKKL